MIGRCVIGLTALMVSTAFAQPPDARSPPPPLRLLQGDGTLLMEVTPEGEVRPPDGAPVATVDWKRGVLRAPSKVLPKPTELRLPKPTGEGRFSEEVGGYFGNTYSGAFAVVVGDDGWAVSLDEPLRFRVQGLTSSHESRVHFLSALYMLGQTDASLAAAREAGYAELRRCSVRRSIPFGSSTVTVTIPPTYSVRAESTEDGEPVAFIRGLGFNLELSVLRPLSRVEPCEIPPEEGGKKQPGVQGPPTRFECRRLVKEVKRKQDHFLIYEESAGCHVVNSVLRGSIACDLTGCVPPDEAAFAAKLCETITVTSKAPRKEPSAPRGCTPPTSRSDPWLPEHGLEDLKRDLSAITTLLEQKKYRELQKDWVELDTSFLSDEELQMGKALGMFERYIDASLASLLKSFRRAPTVRPRLNDAGNRATLLGPEARHDESLQPLALLRREGRWRLVLTPRAFGGFGR